MRILRHKSANAGYYIVDSWKKTAEYCGFEFNVWDDSKWSADAVFQSFKPDIYFADVGNLSPVIIDCALTSKCKTVLAVHQFPEDNEYIEELKRWGYYTTPTHIKLAKQLKPNFVYHQSFPDILNYYWGGWKKEGFDLRSIPFAGDILKYWPEDGLEKNVDWSYVGDFVHIKAFPAYFAYIYPLMHKYKGVIVGNNWPNYLGKITQSCTEEEFRILTCRSKISLQIHEPDSRIYGGNVAERVYKTALCGTVGMCDGNPSVVNDVSLYFRSCKDPDSFYAAATDDIERTRNESLQVIRDVVHNHTYFDRLYDLLDCLGFSDEASIVKNKKRQAIKEWRTKSELGKDAL